MNYYYPIRQSKGLKGIIEFLLSINFNKIMKKISGTYLNNPDLALYYFGKKLSFSHTNFRCNKFLAKKIVNKKLFIGGGCLVDENKKNIVEFISKHNTYAIRESMHYFMLKHKMYHLSNFGQFCGIATRDFVLN